ncbi:MAG TPA: hypothetical protein VGP07_22385 [Polyangia bacterium]|jgi:hypothetical protein
MDLKRVITEFTERLHAVIEAHSMEQARAAVMRALGVDAPRRPGRPAKASALPAPAKKLRKKPPRQLCPVPGCKNVAAPVFGMVCADHKAVAKSKIKKFRDARKATKLGGKAVAKRPASKPAKKRVTRKAAVAARPTPKRAPKAKPKRTLPSPTPKVEPEAVPTPPAA